MEKNPQSSSSICEIGSTTDSNTQIDMEKQIKSYQTQEKGNILCEHLKEIFTQFQIDFRYQPNGTQQFPDFIIQNQYGELLNIECKSGRCGGDTLGLGMANIKVTHFVEINEEATKSHIANFPESELLGSDIIQIPDEDFAKLKGKVDLVFGGFPCQSFSHGGKKDPDDPRGWLFIHFVRAVQQMQPKFIIDLIIAEFAKIGYEMTHFLLSADQFGVPQSRKRVLFVGTHKSLNVHDKIMSRIEKIQPVKPNPIKQIIENSLEGAIDISDHPIKDEIKIYKKIPDSVNISGKPPTMLVKCQNGTDNHGFSFEKRKKSTYSCVVNIDGITNTIQCTYGRMPRLFVPLTNSKQQFLRPFTINELKQIQGFPKDFILKGNLMQQITQIGNAVPPQVVKPIAEALFR